MFQHIYKVLSHTRNNWCFHKYIYIVISHTLTSCFYICNNGSRMHQPIDVTILVYNLFAVYELVHEQSSERWSWKEAVRHDEAVNAEVCTLLEVVFPSSWIVRIRLRFLWSTTTMSSSWSDFKRPGRALVMWCERFWFLHTFNCLYLFLFPVILNH